MQRGTMFPALLAIALSLGTASATPAAGTPAPSATLPVGCGNELPDGIELGVSKNTTIEIEGVERHYRIHLPDSYDASVPVPLILSYHGRGKDMKFQEELSQFSNKSNNPNAIAVYPQGVPVSLAPVCFTAATCGDSHVKLLPSSSRLTSSVDPTLRRPPARINGLETSLPTSR